MEVEAAVSASSNEEDAAANPTTHDPLPYPDFLQIFHSFVCNQDLFLTCGIDSVYFQL